VFSIDTILNLAWASLCAGALVWHLWRDRKSGAGKRAMCSRRTLSLIVAAVALFPCISATDDRMSLADIDWNPAKHAALTRSSGHGLPLLLQEDPEHGQTATAFLLAFLVCFFLIVRPKAQNLMAWFSWISLGRAPPTPAVA
jgi:hypothetical protein